jgi:hypothetical protein
VRCLTRWVRRSTSRRSIRVRSSATHVPGKKSAAEQLGEDPGVDLVGLHLGLRDRPRVPPVDHLVNDGRSIGEIASEFVVASRRLVVEPQPGRPRTKPSGRTPIRPPRHDRRRPRQPRSANERCTSIPIDLTSGSPLYSVGEESAGRKRQKRIRARSAVGSVAGAAKY